MSQTAFRFNQHCTVDLRWDKRKKTQIKVKEREKRQGNIEWKFTITKACSEAGQGSNMFYPSTSPF